MANGKPYMTSGDRYMRENAGKVQAKLMAQHLGRPLTSIWNRARYLGLDLKTKRTFEYWKAPEDQALIELANEGKTTKQIAAILERPLASVANRRVIWVRAGKISQ